MNSIIRPMTPKDKNSVLEMMRVFYASPAVFTNGSDDISAPILKTASMTIHIWKAIFLRFPARSRAMA